MKKEISGRTALLLVAVVVASLLSVGFYILNRPLEPVPRKSDPVLPAYVPGGPGARNLGIAHKKNEIPSGL